MKGFAFAGLAAPVAFHDGAEVLLESLDALVSGWPRLPAADSAHAQVNVFCRGGHYVISAPWLEQPVVEAEAARAAGNLAVDLIEGYLAAHPDQLCLHCGAAEFAGQLVLFPGHSRAGKSTLMARLCAAGVPVLGDDVLPTDNERDLMGGSFGVAPRLRLPLPDCAGDALTRFVARHAWPVDASSCYLRAPADLAPRFGRQAPIGAVVLLDRTDTAGPASLTGVGAGDGLQALIAQNLAPELTVPRLVERLHRMLATVPCFRLHYHDLDGACTILQRHFPAACHMPPTVPPDAARSGALRARDDGAHAAVPPDQPYLRSLRMRLHELDDGAFVVDPVTERVHRLNPLAAGVWRLLAEPCSVDEAVAVICQAFPGENARQVYADVSRLFAELAATGLIVAVADQAAGNSPVT